MCNSMQLIRYTFIHCIMYYYCILPFLFLSLSGCHERTTLHAIVHLPVKTFNKDVVTIATHCWQWLIAACPDLEFKVMREGRRELYCTCIIICSS